MIDLGFLGAEKLNLLRVAPAVHDAAILDQVSVSFYSYPDESLSNCDKQYCCSDVFDLF